MTLGVIGNFDAGSVAAQERSVRVEFGRSQSSTVIRGTVRGYDGASYRINVRGSQRLAVTMNSSNSSNYFNILGPSGGEALFNGSISGDFADIIVPTSGDYVVQVYLMRNAARRNEQARFTLRIEVTGGRPITPPSPDFADGLSGGPDFFEVAGIARGDALNIRTRPSAQSPIVTRVVNGEILRNGGCRMTGQTRWCRVSRPDGSNAGWAAGRFLIEASN
ncbi:Gifsy-1 prophage protein [Agrobacterium albertimagni AOL15]|uniref:Gifsy-1 prophage protein n=1 Tax=Agrobacterium albertimagni AOL15 TaxID=1156935 RepID=K2PDU4_9HYPH|nr:SH3 domain-containing protein [Agrobacterium albertimagni]EKF59098.1 Gifsy-1 prophage protein [Agrobacterium albertimagni AOL15]